MSTLNVFFNKPESIKDINFGNPPSVYEAYLYRFTCLDTGRIYVGIHKGYVGDGYWHSSTNKDFDKILANADSNLRYEILEYGDYNQMTVSENKLLESVDAKNNPLYFNKTNGSPKYRPIDLDRVKELASEITKGTYNTDTKEPIDVISKLKTLQVRFQEDHEHVKDISERIDDAGGNTDKCNPVVIYEKRQEGSDIVGDGNHTIAAIVKSKHGRDVPVARIPLDIHGEFTNEELIAVSNLLNKPSEVVKKRASKEDMVKYVLKQYSNGVPVDDSSNKEFLKEMRFTNKQIKAILIQSKKEIDLANLQKANQLWIDYSSGSGKKTLTNKVESYRDKDTMCIAVSSAMFRWDHIFNHIFDNTLENPKTKIREQGKTKLVILVHHNGPEAEDKWKSDYQPDAIRKLKYYLHPLKYEFQIIEMPTTITNTLS
jgi:hypothetical protein